MISKKLYVSFFSIFLISAAGNGQSDNVEIGGLSIQMVFVPGGKFQMGSNSGKSDESPQHRVKVNGFWMSAYEITWVQYDEFITGEVDNSVDISNDRMRELGIDGISSATPAYIDMSFGMGKENRPATGMTQYAALMFCKWLSARSGNFYRLPTEAEWEYACKLGNTMKDDPSDIAWFKENSHGKYAEVGTKKSNDIGIYDMLGNVSEWTMDQYDSSFYRHSPKNNPWNKPKVLYPRILRGGAWNSDREKLNCTSRTRSNPKWKKRDPQIPKSDWWYTDAPFVGFRIVRPEIQPSPREIKEYWLNAIEDFSN